MVYLIPLACLIAIAVAAIRKAEDENWRWANIGIIAGSILLAILLTAVIGLLLHDDNFLPQMGPTLVLILGLLSAIGAVAGNKWRSGGIRKGHKVEYSKDDKTVS